MYSIGELSKLVQISIDALRHYDEIGLLKPHYTDPVTKYRYYSAEQIHTIVALMQWKRLGFSLEQIKELLNHTDTARLDEIYRHQLKKLRDEREQLDLSIADLQVRVDKLREGFLMETKSVLIVDDAAFIREILTDLMKKNGLIVLGAAPDGESAIRQYEELRPDVVILDIGLPDMDGIEVAKRMREKGGRAHLVACSGRATLANVLRGLQAGIADFVAKPFMPDVLLDAVLNDKIRGIDLERVSEVWKDERVQQLTDCLPQHQINRILNSFDPHLEKDPLSDDAWSKLLT